MTAGRIFRSYTFFFLAPDSHFLDLHKIWFYLVRSLPYANAFLSHWKIEILLCAKRDKRIQGIYDPKTKDMKRSFKIEEQVEKHFKSVCNKLKII